MYKSQLFLPKHLTFGVEIEFQHANREWSNYKLEEWNKNRFSDKYSYWTMTPDNSIITNIDGVEYGGEIASSILIDEARTWKHLKEICIMLENMGAKTTDLTGGHIHFGAQILGNNVKHWLNFIKLWIAYENIIYKFSHNGEKGRAGINEYARPVRDVYLPILKENMKFIDEISMSSFLLQFYLEKKEYGINLSSVSVGSFFKGNTIEIRCPNGTVNHEVWQNNINFFANLLLYCSSEDYEDDLIMKRINKKTDDATELADLIYTKKMEKNNFLKQYNK